MTSFDGLNDLDLIIKEYKDHCYSEKDPYNCYLYIWEREYLTLITKKLKKSGTNFSTFTVEENTKLTEEENKLIGNEFDVVIGENSKSNKEKLEEAIGNSDKKIAKEESEGTEVQSDTKNQEPTNENLASENLQEGETKIEEGQEIAVGQEVGEEQEIETMKKVEKKQTNFSELKALNHQYLQERGILPENSPENTALDFADSDEEEVVEERVPPKYFENADDEEEDRIMSGMFANYARKGDD